MTNAAATATSRTNGPAGKNAAALAAASAYGNTNSAAGYDFQTFRVEDPNPVHELQTAGIQYSGAPSGSATETILAWVVPIAIAVLLWRFIARRMGYLGQGLFEKAKAQAPCIKSP